MMAGLIKIGAKVVSHGRYVTFQMGRGRGAATDVRRHPGADRPAPGTARTGMTSASQVRRAIRERYALVQANRRVSALGHRQPPTSLAVCSR